MSERIELDIRKLLQGKFPKKKVEFIAAKIDAAHYNYIPDIQNLPRLGRVGGEAPQDLITFILARHAASQVVEVLEVVPEPVSPAPEVVEWHATPAAKELADKHNIDLSTVRGTGQDGAIVKSDVETLIAYK